jgi:hypothetical protein
VELYRQRIHQEYQNEEVERVERPPQKAGGYRVPLVRTGCGSKSQFDRSVSHVQEDGVALANYKPARRTLPNSSSEHD